MVRWQGEIGGASSLAIGEWREGSRRARGEDGRSAVMR